MFPATSRAQDQELGRKEEEELKGFIVPNQTHRLERR